MTIRIMNTKDLEKEIVVWEKNTETNEVEKVTVKVVVGQLNQFVYDNEVGVEYFINREDVK